MSEAEAKKLKILSKEEIASHLMPYNENAVLAFFQKIGRWWMGVWSYFADNKPKLAKFIYTFTLFYLFSNVVTVFQWVLVQFIPYWFGMDLAGVALAWPGIPYTVFGEQLEFIIFGYPVLEDAGQVIIGGGLGFFYSWLIATFLAQCINFPLQRNFTYRSKGNPWYQAMWYLIGWIGINLVIWIIIGNLAAWNSAFIGIPVGLMNVINMVIQGGVAMLIFYFIFLVIFPDVHKLADSKEAYAERKRTELEEAKTGGNQELVKSAELAYETALAAATKMRKMSNVKKAETLIRSTKSTCESKIIKVISTQEHLDKLREKGEDATKITHVEEHLEKAIEAASTAILERDGIIKENELIISQNS